MDLDDIVNSQTPLAARLRPRTAEEVFGQDRVLAPGTPIRRLLEGNGSGAAASVILWGPPGSGKTSIAQVIAENSSAKFEQLSAISAGVKEVREVIDRARNDSTLFRMHTVLFLDEIHRFTKAQQDSLLPAVEAGWITLVAATTENPSFAVISPLLSRSIIVRLEPLSDDEISRIVYRALEDTRGFAGKVTVQADALSLLIRIAQGDARRALTALEASVFLATRIDSPKDAISLNVEHVEQSLNQVQVRYDRAGDGHYDTISAFIKSVRGSDADAALHYLALMVEAGEDPRFIARRLIILASEDIGLADPTALPLAVAAADAVALIGMPEGRIPLAEVTIYLALAPKSNSAYKAIDLALDDVRSGRVGQVPAYLRGTGYPGAEKLGSGVGYLYPHDMPGAVAEQNYLPNELRDRVYYKPTSIGREAEFSSLWEKLKSLVRGQTRNK